MPPFSPQATSRRLLAARGFEKSTAFCASSSSVPYWCLLPRTRAVCRLLLQQGSCGMILKCFVVCLAGDLGVLFNLQLLQKIDLDECEVTGTLLGLSPESFALFVALSHALLTMSLTCTQGTFGCCRSARRSPKSTSTDATRSRVRPAQQLRLYPSRASLSFPLMSAPSRHMSRPSRVRRVHRLARRATSTRGRKLLGLRARHGCVLGDPRLRTNVANANASSAVADFALWAGC